MRSGLGLGLGSLSIGGVAAPVAPIITGAPFPPVADVAGAGFPVTIPVVNSTGCTGATLGGVAVTSFAIVDATHVRGIPGAHASGVVDVVVTNGVGPSTTGAGLFKYWTPSQIANISEWLHSNKNVTNAGGGAISAWLGQFAAKNFTQAASGNRPNIATNVFGTMPSVQVATSQWLELAATAHLTNGKSYFAVVKTADNTARSGGSPGLNSTARPAGTIIGDASGDYTAFGFDAGQLALQQYNAAGSSTHYQVRGSGLADGIARLVGVTSDLVSNEKFYVGTVQQGTTYTPGVVDDDVQGYRTIGAGYAGGAAGPHANFFIGHLGAIAVVDGVMATLDQADLNAWAQQQFGTP